MATEDIKKYFKDKKVGIFTNSFNPELLKMSTDCYREIEAEPIVIPGIRHGKKFYGDKMFRKVLSNRTIRRKYDYLIYVDEDCFISDLNELYLLVRYFIENDYGFCGMPDGGVACLRCHNPVSINTFFTIFNMKKIKKVYRRRKVRRTVYTTELDKFIPHHLIKKELPDNMPEFCKFVEESGQIPYGIIYDNYEPYYKIFFHLLLNGCKPLYLNAKDSALDNGTTTELMSHLGNVFCYHTWYARNYSTDPENKHRIDSVYRSVTENRDH